MTKDRKVTESDRQWYRLGYLNGQSQLQQTLEVLQTSISYLASELARLDRDEPRVGVLLNYEMVDRVIKGLRKPTKNFPLANTIDGIKKKAQKNDAHTALMAIKQA